MKSDYQIYYDRILKNGSPSVPRGLPVIQCINNAMAFSPGIVYRRPHDNPAIGFVELFQFLLGTFDVKQIEVVAPHARLDLFTGQSAYGPRTIGQFERVIAELRADPASRRAMVFIADKWDLPPTLPCTLSMQFQISSGRLITTVNMRSSDAVWGLPYDMIQFGGVAMMIANCLNVEPGWVQVNMGNGHVYDASRLKDGEEFKEYGKFFFTPMVNTWERVQYMASTSLQALVMDPKHFLETVIERRNP
jgi:hypothetical protein